MSRSTIRLHHLIDIESGTRIAFYDNDDDIAISIGGEHIQNGKFYLNDNIRILPINFYNNHKTGRILLHDTLLVKDGATIGKSMYVANKPYQYMMVNEHVFVLRSRSMSSRYLAYLISSQTVQDIIWSLNVAAAQPGLSRDFAKYIRVPLTERCLQRAIADFLDAETERIDALVAKKQRLIDLLTERRQALITQAVTKGLHRNVAMKDSGIEWLGDIPAHWQIAPVNRYYSVQLGKMLQNSPAALGDSEIPYLKAQHVQWFQVNTIDATTMWANRDDLKKYRVVPGDLLVCEGGEGGRCGIVNHIEGVYIIQNALHRVRARKGGCNVFLQYLLSSAAASNWFDVLNNKATIAHFTNEKFKALLIPIPPFLEQRAIADFLDTETARIDALISKLQRQIELLTERRQAIITAAVTGKLDVSAAKQCEPL